MATWDTERHGEWTCPKCGNVYAVESTRYPSKDDNDVRCECGEEIYAGRSTSSFRAGFVRKGDPKDASKNPSL